MFNHVRNVQAMPNLAVRCNFSYVAGTVAHGLCGWELRMGDVRQAESARRCAVPGLEARRGNGLGGGR